MSNLHRAEGLAIIEAAKREGFEISVRPNETHLRVRAIKNDGATRTLSPQLQSAVNNKRGAILVALSGKTAAQMDKEATIAQVEARLRQESADRKKALEDFKRAEEDAAMATARRAEADAAAAAAAVEAASAETTAPAPDVDPITGETITSGDGGDFAGGGATGSWGDQ